MSALGKQLNLAVCQTTLLADDLDRRMRLAKTDNNKFRLLLNLIFSLLYSQNLSIRSVSVVVDSCKYKKLHLK